MRLFAGDGRKAMILSHRHRFIFVKGTKVGGTSVEIALSGICGPDDIVTPVIPIDDKPRIERGHPPRNYASSRAIELDYERRIRECAPGRLQAEELPPQTLVFYNHMPLSEIEWLRAEARLSLTVAPVSVSTSVRLDARLSLTVAPVSVSERLIARVSVSLKLTPVSVSNLVTRLARFSENATPVSVRCSNSAVMWSESVCVMPVSVSARLRLRARLSV